VGHRGHDQGRRGRVRRGGGHVAGREGEGSGRRGRLRAGEPGGQQHRRTGQLRGNDSYTLVAGNAINGKLACSGNDPAPTNNNLPNMVIGRRTNQCAAL
jgi:hypothetical protein